MKKTGRYRVFDCYDCYMSDEWDGKPELLGTGDTFEQIKAIVDNRRDETDGEMYIIIFDMIKQCEVDYDDIKRE